MPAVSKTEHAAQVILKAAPVVATAAPKSESHMRPSPIPPQNVWAGGLGAVVTWFIVYGITLLTGADVDPQLQMAIAGLVGVVLAWLIPPSQGDVIKVLDNETVQIAMKDPLSNVDYVQAPVQPPPGEPATTTPPATKS